MSNNQNRVQDQLLQNNLSTNLTIGRQTAKNDFGSRLLNGLDSTANLITKGATIASGILPGGAIISAAVSSVTNMTRAPAFGGGSASMAYSGALSAGVAPVGGGTNSTTIDNHTSPVGSVADTAMNGNGSSDTSMNSMIGTMSQDIVRAQEDNARFLRLQLHLQEENKYYSAVSNVLKTRHDTVKNAIGNIR